jgi:hypothetical protein
VFCAFGWVALLALAAVQPRISAVTAGPGAAAFASAEDARMWMTVGNQRFAIRLADTAAGRAFAAQLPLTLDMRDLNRNEKYAELPQALRATAEPPGTIRSGDLMLFGTDTLVVFYLSFRSSYAYTRLGRVEDPGGLAQALGTQGVRVMFSRD